MDGLHVRTSDGSPGSLGTPDEWCEFWHKLDDEFETEKSSPLHHDNRCDKCRNTVPPANFKVGQVVRVDGFVTGTWFRARILRAEYSAFFESWAYDIVITQSRSNLYPRGMEEHAVFESMIADR